MDQENANDKDNINSYLLGQLKGKDLQQFTLRLMRDKSLQQEVDESRVLLKTLWKVNKENDGMATTSAKKWWIILFFALTVSIPIIWQLMPDSQVAPSLEKPESTAPAEQPSSTTLPIAANFEPNPMLEMLSDNPVRSALIQLTVEQPTDQAVIKRHEGALFQLSGKVTLSDISDADLDMICYFFSNQTKDFEAFTPLFSDILTTNKITDKEYSFSFQHPLTDTPPGLYYYIIGDVNGEELYHIGKVFLRE